MTQTPITVANSLTTASDSTENALRESDEKFHQLADNITDVFWIRSPDMHEVHYVSPAFEKIWGVPVGTQFDNPQQWTDFIVPEDRERVLKRFVRLEKSRTEPGTGLGLSLVQAVARLHAGSVRLEDNRPGLRVVLTLPKRSDDR